MSEPRIGILLGGHVLERFVERFPNEREARGVIYGEVMRAFVEGRKAKRVPAWCRYSARRRPDPAHRYVWNAEETRCYVVMRVPKRDLEAQEFGRQGEFDQTWTVKTVIARTDTQFEAGELTMIRSFHGLERKLREKRKGPVGRARGPHSRRGYDDEGS